MTDECSSLFESFNSISTAMKNTLLSLVIISVFRSNSAVNSSPKDSCGGCLLLTPYIDQGRASDARNLSQVDPASFFGFRSHSGFINVNEKYGSNLFFWFFPAKKLEVTPWLIWLGGGPGIAATKGLFEVMGPLKVEDGQVKLRDITWATDYSLLFLDTPVGAGFSYTESENGYDDNVNDTGAQMLKFLQQFLKMFPELVKAPLFITGQSYAGKYVPALAIQIHQNKLTNPINLRGIAMGNGLTDPRNMMQYSKLCNSLGILDDKKIDKLKEIEEEAVALTDAGRMVEAANKFNETIVFIENNSGLNIYNFLRAPSKTAPEFETYLNTPEARELLHTGNVTFFYDNQKVYKKMLPDFMHSTKPYVEELLEHYGVMSYSGQLDIILAYSLSRNVFKTLDWTRRSDYVNAPRDRVENDDGKTVAYIKSGGNFVDVLILGAGHGTPVDQPEVSKFIIDQFVETFK